MVRDRVSNFMHLEVTTTANPFGWPRIASTVTGRAYPARLARSAAQQLASHNAPWIWSVPYRSRWSWCLNPSVAAEQQDLPPLTHATRNDAAPPVSVSRMRSPRWHPYRAGVTGLRPRRPAGQRHNRQVAHPQVFGLVAVHQRPPPSHQNLPIAGVQAEHGRFRSCPPDPQIQPTISHSIYDSV
jgi:hypothetical protein